MRRPRACPATASPFLANTSLQDLYARANRDLLAMARQTTSLPPSTCANPAPAPAISLAANAEGGSPGIAPNTWVAIYGSNLAAPGDARSWQRSDFSGGGLTMPTQLEVVSATVNGKAAYIYYISPTQVNILTPPDAISGSVPVRLTYGGQTSTAFMAQAQVLTPACTVEIRLAAESLACPQC